MTELEKQKFAKLWKEYQKAKHLCATCGKPGLPHAMFTLDYEMSLKLGADAENTSVVMYSLCYEHRIEGREWVPEIEAAMLKNAESARVIAEMMMAITGRFQVIDSEGEVRIPKDYVCGIPISFLGGFQ